ncbi:hypothetical protein [Clostridium sp.]|uniref:hypothetical protein n=1 Tax=Clostridium sp. TaxID=1506 RepID=UPI002630509B|nr:hypothetical protein [Clostridium sp.]
MIIPVDKEKVMAEFETKYVEGRFEEEYPRIQEKIDKDKEVIKAEVISKFKVACNKAKNLQKKNLKNEIQYIYISFLRTSIMQNLGKCRIDLYDDKWFLDKEECSIDIDFSFIYEPLFVFIEELQERKKQYGRTITEMDVDKIKLKEGDRYHAIGIKLLKTLVNDLVECTEYKEMEKSDDISIFAGKYRDEAVLIYETPKEK